ncbi:unnamed protein product [Cylicocyclus nassatus]|uniref:G-protein coupled receptors family 1 profile domain-containing protein n=1 Tax=Cylicocyclus nassatus TaxID=53992 RepID=A0AA36HC42_CYLNA|nr:unnamed protein product [Cylicocyclus nassatus]
MSEALDCFRDAHSHEPLITDRIWLGASLIFFTAISFVLNLLLLIITVKMRILDKRFQYHVISLIIASIVYLSADILDLIPATVGAVHMPDPWNIILSSTDNLGYLALMFTNTNVAIDRFMSFYLSKVQQSLASNKTAYAFFASIPCITSVLITVSMAFEGCYIHTDPYKLTFSYLCSTCIFFGPLLNYFGYIFPGINFLLYGLIYVEILRKQMRFKGVANANPEDRSLRQRISLVIQFSLICATQFASSVCYYILPILLPNSDVAFQLPMVFSVLNTMANPVVTLLLQARVRKAYMTIIRSRSISLMNIFFIFLSLALFALCNGYVSPNVYRRVLLREGIPERQIPNKELELLAKRIDQARSEFDVKFAEAEFQVAVRRSYRWRFPRVDQRLALTQLGRMVNAFNLPIAAGYNLYYNIRSGYQRESMRYDGDFSKIHKALEASLLREAAKYLSPQELGLLERRIRELDQRESRNIQLAYQLTRSEGIAG